MVLPGISNLNLLPFTSILPVCLSVCFLSLFKSTNSYSAEMVLYDLVVLLKSSKMALAFWSCSAAAGVCAKPKDEIKSKNEKIVVVVIFIIIIFLIKQ